VSPALDEATVREQLHLPAVSTLWELADSPLPRSDSALGFASDDLWQRVTRSPATDPVVLGIDFPLRIWQTQAGVYQLRLRPSDQLVRVNGSTHTASDGSLWLDARVGAVMGHVHFGTGSDLVFALDAAHCRVWSLEFEITPPTLGALNAESAEDWLRQRFEQLVVSPFALDRLIAVGFVLRHATVVLPDGRFDLDAIDRILGARQDAIASWLRTLPSSTRKTLLDQAREQAEALVESLLDLDEITDPAAPELSPRVEHLCEERERLAAALEVLHLDDAGAFPEKRTALSEYIEQLDNEAAAHGGTLAGAQFENELLCAVSLLRPDAWWAKAASQGDGAE
jgi:hypothetical protein